MIKTFSKPKDVIEFIKECVEENNTEKLYSETLEETSAFWKEKIFNDFKDLNRDNLLEEVFLSTKQKCFSLLLNHVSLGGCDDKNKHLNIDLEKQKGHWVIKKVWKCR